MADLNDGQEKETEDFNHGDSIGPQFREIAVNATMLLKGCRNITVLNFICTFVVHFNLCERTICKAMARA